MNLIQIDVAIPRTFSAPTCAACTTTCCERLPGALTPAQLGAPDETLLAANLATLLRSGRYAIDWWEDMDDRGYYVRPAVQGDNRIMSPTWGGRCTFLTPAGCELTAENRPAECCALEPRKTPNAQCIQLSGGKYEFSERWRPYWGLIDRIVGELQP